MADEQRRTDRVRAGTAAQLRDRYTAELAEIRAREILAAASRLFADNGYHETSVTDIARELDIAHGTIYRYFTNKRDILDRVLDDLASRFLQASVIENAPDAASNIAEYRSQVERFATTFWQLLDTEPAFRMLLHHADSADPELSRRTHDFLASGALLVSGYLDNGLSRGFLRADLDSLATAEAVVALTVGSMLFHGKSDAAARDHFTAALIALMFHGVAV